MARRSEGRRAFVASLLNKRGAKPVTLAIRFASTPATAYTVWVTGAVGHGVLVPRSKRRGMQTVPLMSRFAECAPITA